MNRLAISRKAAGGAGTKRAAAQVLAINQADKERPVGAMPDMADPWSIPEPSAPGFNRM
jgi:hypothetical protein